MPVTDNHEEKGTLTVDVIIPGHDPRVDTPEYRQSHIEAVKRDGGCLVCGKADTLETHHVFVERCMTNLVDRGSLETMLNWIHNASAAAIAQLASLSSDADMMQFVDSTANLLTLCHDHHLGKDEGIHMMDFPRWAAQWYGVEGYQYTADETLHHERMQRNLNSSVQP